MGSILRGVVRGFICRHSASTFLVSSLFIATLLVALPQEARAATYNVCPTCTYTTPDDAVNNAGVVDGDTIDVQTGTYVLVNTLQVSNSITILANNSVFDADDRRAIEVTGSTTVLSLTNVTIRNGLADASGGGALLVSGGAKVVIVNGTFEDNRADYGGAIHNIGSTVQINVAVFTGNRATVGDGGAVLTDSGGSTTLERTSVDGNRASVAGGGAAVADNNSQLSFIASTVSNNVVVTAALDQSNDTLTGTTNSCGNNVPATQGQTFLPIAEVLTAFEFEVRLGGDVNFHPAPGTVLQGRVRLGGQSGNVIATANTVWSAGLSGGASLFLHYELNAPLSVIPGDLYAIEIDTIGPQTFSIYTISGDSYLGGSKYSSCGGPSPTDDYDFKTFGGAAGDGGGIYASSAGFAGLFNTTVSGNVGDGATAGPDSNAIVSTLFSTITNNSGNGLTAKNGGSSDGLVFITASIVADNGGNDCDGGITTSGYNLIGDDTNCTVTPFTGDLIGTTGAPIDPMLGPLQNNGGWTSTHAIDLNSPAFDAAGPIAQGLPCFDATDDQRGAARPDGPFCDIGAYEVVVPVSAGNLQLLIDAATANEETLISVPDGVYDELITLGNGQILQGSGPDNVVINATGLGGSAITASGDFTLRGIRVTGGGSSGSGGGISARMAGTDITLSNVVFDNNDATYDGGAIFLANGTLNGTNVTFGNNSAGRDGGAIAGGASVSISASLFEGNTAADRGGAVFNDGNLSITDTTINSSVAGLGGGVFNNDVTDVLEVSGSTFSNNTANTAGVTAGGAIGGAGTTDIRNSTISGNSATAGNGGGIGLTAGSANLNNVTLAFNSASSGGPFYVNQAASLSLSNSLLSNNTGGATICSTVVSAGYNLFDIAPCPVAASDITAEPLINILASNGGPTQTHSLGSTSPARDAANPGQLVIEIASALSSSQLTFNGVATESGGDLVAVRAGGGAGSIFASAPDEGPFDLTGSFSTQFSFQITDQVPLYGESSGDGFTFAIAANATVLGDGGGRLGVATYSGPPLGTVSVEFDTYPNGADVSGNAIGINVGGYSVDLDSVFSAAQTAIPGEFDDGNVWTAWIEYHADTNRLDVRVAADGIRPDLPQLTHVVDIAAEVGATGYYGFTGGIAQASATHSVTDWEFFITSCPSFDQRGEPRPQGVACDIGAYEAAAIPLVMGDVYLNAVTDQNSNTSYPGVVKVPIIDIPIEKLTGDTFNSPSSAPLGSFPLGSFPIGSFDLRNSPMGSFPLGSFPIGSFPIGSFPIGSFPIGSFPLSSIPLQSAGGWTEILNGTELADAPLQTVTLEQVMTLDPLPNSVATIALRDLSIEGSPLGSFSLPGLSLGDTTVAELDQWATNADETDEVCATLIDEGFTDCDTDDTLLSLEYKGAPVSALSLSSLPLGSFPIGSFPIGSFPIGSFPLGSFPLGSFPIGSFPIGSFPIGSFPLGSFPIGSFPLGSFNLLAAPLGSFPLGSFPIGSFPLGSFEIDGESFCKFYDEQAVADGDMTCEQLDVSPVTDTLADLVEALQTEAVRVGDTTGGIGSTPLGSFPLGSFPIGSFPIGSFPIGSFDLGSAPLSLLTLDDFGGCEAIYGVTGCTVDTPLSDTSSLADVEEEYITLAASPLGSFPIGSFGIADLPMGSFPIGSFDVNGAPLGSFPLGSFDLIFSPLGSFPIGSFPLGSFGAIIDDPEGLCLDCLTLADAARVGVISSTATLEDLQVSTEFATTTLGEVLDAMTLATLYCPPEPVGSTTGPLVECAETLGQIKDPGNLTLGQLLIAMMLKTDFPWETIPLDQLDAQEFSADNIISYLVDFSLTGSETESVSVTVTVADSFLYEKGSASLVIETPLAVGSPTPIADPIIIDNGDGTQTLTYNLILGGFGFTNNTIRFNAVPALALGGYPATATVQLGTDVPVEADNSLASVTIIPDPETDKSEPVDAPVAPADVLLLGYIDAQDDNDYFLVEPPAAGDRVAVFMSNPIGDNDLIMYEPITTVEAKGQTAESPALDSVPFEDDGVSYGRNLAEEPNALEDVNLATAPLASISTNRGSIDESVSAIAGDTEPFMIQVSGYNGATSVQPYTLRVKVTPQVPSPQCTARSWPGTVSWPQPADLTMPLAGEWTERTNAVFLVNGARLAASEVIAANEVSGPTDAEKVAAFGKADAALTAIIDLLEAPGIEDGVVVDVSTILGVNTAYVAWDLNPCDVDAPNAIVNAITKYLEVQRLALVSSDLAYVTIVGSDEVIPFARKPDETSIANESTFAGEFSDNAMYGALVTRHFLSDDTYGDIDPIPWLDRYLNVPELGVGRLVESAADIQTAAENYIASSGVLDPQTALSAGYDFIADASEEIHNTFSAYSTVLGIDVEPKLIDQPDVLPGSAWTKARFLGKTGIVPSDALDPLIPVDLVSFNMHFDFDEALPSSGDAGGNYTDNLINVSDLAGADLTGGIWFTVGCHSGSSVADVSVVGAPSEDWAQTFGRQGALYLAQNAYGLGDTEAVALTERLMANFARNLNGSLSIGQAHAFAKQQYFADLGLYGEYDYKALQAATLFGLPMYQYGNGAMVVDVPLPPLPVAADPLSGLTSASWSLSDTGISRETGTSKGDLFSVDGEVQFVHFRPLQPIVRRDVTGPNGETASGAFLTSLVTEDIQVLDIAFARPVIDLGENETEIESDEVVFPTAFTNIASYKAPAPDGGPFESRSQLNVIVGQFTSPPDGGSSGTERLFRSFDAQVFYRSAASASTAMATATVTIEDDFIRPEFDNVQASVVGSGGAQQAAFSVDVFDESTVERVAVLYLQSVAEVPGENPGDPPRTEGNWVLVDLVQGGGSNTWTGGGPVDLDGTDGEIDYMVQAVDSNGNVANSTFKGLFYVAEELPPAPAPDPDADPDTDPIGVEVSVDGEVVDPGDWIPTNPVNVSITNQNPEKIYLFSVDFAPFELLTSEGFRITEDGVHIVTVQESDGSNPVTFVVLIDTTLPRALITTPANGEFVEQGKEPAAEFDCLDAGSGISTCVGTVPDGAPVPSVNPGSQSFTLTAQDYAHQNDDPPSPVVAEHVYHVVKPLEVGGPINPTAITDPYTINVSATDLIGFTETVTIDWGDSSELQKIILSDLSAESVSNLDVNHPYPAADVYQVTVTVDYEGQYTQAGVVDFVVIYDPSDGFVTGGGWINSPPGAYIPDADLTGKANFGFVSKYKKGQSVPSGSTTFRFAAGDLKFEATAYDWMIITGSRARYKGVGTIKGETGLYKFQVTALDADISGYGITQDGFRIKIWQEGANGVETVLYDNGLGADDSTGSAGTTPLGGGSIKIHQVKKGK